MGMILVARNPISGGTIDKLLSHRGYPSSFSPSICLIEQLGCVLTGASSYSPTFICGLLEEFTPLWLPAMVYQCYSA